jgi:hypothetical protein
LIRGLATAGSRINFLNIGTRYAVVINQQTQKGGR